MKRACIALLLVLSSYAVGQATGDGDLLSLTGTVAVAQSSCTPRPPVQVRAQKGGSDAVFVTISAASTVQRVRFGPARHAILYLPGNGPWGSFGNVDFIPKPPSTQLQFFVRQRGGLMHVPFTVVDACGDWPTFIGGGTTIASLTPTSTPTPTPTLTPTPTATPNEPFDPTYYIRHGNRFNCVDFWSQAQTQAVLRADPTDPNRLDISSPSDSLTPDGIACNTRWDAPEWTAWFYFPPPFDRTPVVR